MSLKIYTKKAGVMMGSDQQSGGSWYGSVSSESIKHQEQHSFVAYSQRWVVLLTFSLLSCMNHWIWITWSPMTTAFADFLSVPASDIDNLSAVFMYTYIPLSFPAMNFLHRYKLRCGLLFGSCLNFAGSIVRFWGMQSYSWVYFGTLLCALCQTLTLAMPPLISTIWFQETERGLATSLGVLANQLGSAFGLGATILIDFAAAPTEQSPLNADNLEIYLELQMILSGLCLALVVFCVPSSAPSTPPSEAAYSQKETTYEESIRLLVQNISGSVLCVVYGLVVGVLYALATFLSQFFLDGGDILDDSSPQRQWSGTEVGYLGVVHVMAGLLGALLSGKYLDETQSSHRTICLALLMGAIPSMLSFLLFLEFIPWNRYCAYLILSLLGIFLTGFVSVGLEYGTAISYPADDAAVAGVMNVAAQIGGWGYVALGGALGPMSQTFRAFLLGMLFLSFILLGVFVRAQGVRPTSE